MMESAILAFMLVQFFEGFGNATVSEFHLAHAPNRHAQEHCHAGEDCADPHTHLGKYKS